MGGNRKQANRTKNNARPANSGRSAELLGTTPAPFVGFSAVKDGAFVTVLPGFSSNIEDINPDVDPNFQILLKKMNKKDSTTKLKALQEFSELIQGSEVEAVKAILPFWPRLYCQLATDAEHRVREALHQAQRVVVSKAKRNIAPFLKQLAGPWFTSQYDTYAPAATAAQRAFQEAFPPNKLLKAITFCQEEILAYITDNLTVQSAQTLSNPKSTAPEDMESKHQRVLISSLQGYVLYLHKLPSEQLKSARESNLKLVSHPKFWKLAKHAAPLVRSAWFSAIIALCQKSPDLVTSEASRVVMATLGHLDESDPAVLPVVWEAALHVITTVPDCWTHVNADKVVLPKLYNLAREGGQGNAGSIFPNLLPFLSKLPESITSDKQAFYDKFFASMRTGFTQKCVVQSPSESAAVAKCYVECLKYSIMTNQKDTALCLHIIQSQLMPAVRLVLTDSRLNLFYSTHFTQISLLIQQWDRNVSTPLNAQLLETFWRSMEEVNADCLCPPHTDSMEPIHQPLAWTLERQVALCLSLRNPMQKRTVNLRVKFSSDGNDNPDNGSPDAVSPDHSKEFAGSLFRFVRSVCVIYVNLTKSYNTTSFLKHLSKLVTVFDSKELFTSFLNVDNINDSSSKTKSLFTLFTNPLQDWLKNEEMEIEPVIDMTLVLLKHLEPTEKTAVLDAIGQLCLGPSAVHCLTAALKHRDEDSVANFLQSEQTYRVLATLVRGVCEGSAERGDWVLIIQCCVSKTRAGDFVVPDQAFCDLVSILEHDAPSDATASLADVFFSVRLNEATMTRAEDFFLHLLSLSVIVLELVPAVDQAGRTFNRAGRLEIVMEKVAAFVWDELKANRHTPDTKMGCDIEVDQLASAVYRFLVASSCESSLPVEPIRRFLEMCSVRLTGLEPVMSYLTRDNFETRQDAGSCECQTLRIPEDLSLDEALDLHLASLLFNFLLLEKLTARDDGEDETSEDKDEASAFIMYHSSLDKALEPLKDQVAVLTNSMKVCSAFAARYPSTVYNYKIFTRNMTVDHICYNLRKWDALQIDASICRPREKACKVGLKLPWNRIVTKPEVSSEASTSQDSSEDQQLPECVPAAEISTREILTCWTEISADQSDLDVFDTILTLDRKLFLFECDVNAEYEFRVLSVATTAQFTAKLIDSRAEEMKPKHWDFVLIALASWMQSVKKSDYSLLVPSESFPVRPLIARSNIIEATDDETADLGVASTSHSMDEASTSHNAKTMAMSHNHNAAVLTEAVCELFVAFCRYLNAVAPKDEEKCAARNKMKQEWKDLFEQDTNNVIVDVFILITEHSRRQELSLLDLPAIEAVALALQSVDVTKCAKRDALLECCLQTICSPIVVLQLAAFHGLHDLAFSLALKDSETLLTSETLSTLSTQLTLHLLLPHLDYTKSVVSAMLADVRPGESCIVAPYTDASTYTLAYLMTWTVVLAMCKHADSVLRSQYAAIIREGDYLDPLLRAIFRLMPEEVLVISHGKNKSRRTQDLFSVAPRLVHDQIVMSATVEQLACWVYWLCLCQLPAEVRAWWSNVDQRYCSLVDRVTTNHVSPVLCDLEMKTVQTHVAKRKSNITIKVHASVNEVHAVYTVDEARLELSMSLPSNYPLGLVVIDTKNTEKIQESGKEGRGWLMQLRMFLSHQNGSLWEGLSLWKSNLDKKFEGVEECYICYSILHGSNFQLPKVACRTCKKKFHSGCMYKWFNTSNKPTCPICRNQF